MEVVGSAVCWGRTPSPMCQDSLMWQPLTLLSAVWRVTLAVGKEQAIPTDCPPSLQLELWSEGKLQKIARMDPENTTSRGLFAILKTKSVQFAMFPAQIVLPDHRTLKRKQLLKKRKE